MLGKISGCVFFLLFLLGCESKVENITDKDSVRIFTEIGMLSKLIVVPETIEAIQWRVMEDDVRGASTLIAFFKLGSQAYEEISKQSIRYESPVETVVSVDVFEQWIDASLKSSLESIKADDSVKLPTSETVGANVFVLGGMSPFVNGSVILLGENSLILQMYAN